jgi:hypothetical protein
MTKDSGSCVTSARRVCLAAIIAIGGTVAASAAPVVELPGDRTFPESITSTPQGILYVSSFASVWPMKYRMMRRRQALPVAAASFLICSWSAHQRKTPRFATGLRNGESISFDASGRIFATQHGRDQLLEDWPQLYKPKQGQNLSAEELVQLERDADYGWPECYFDNDQQKLVLAPEYGGDGGKMVGVCAQKWPPVAFFPRTGLQTICRSTTERSFRRPIAAAP